MKNEERWFRVSGAITYVTEHFVQAANRDEAVKVYWGMDITDTDDLRDPEILEVEECENPVK